ncbi:hypothetical protein BV25DRAFT_1138913 [Artomyces pyxidatus]|uniref:Uncharacterized protein n=1 Tax=Artomyces pyxidatus TaxID=48021 RepID=A0ACB8SUA1_9AGAM|nr:hypothetical protein BV25DRAFT_1138913 [Artomyces pyxidatus]
MASIIAGAVHGPTMAPTPPPLAEKTTASGATPSVPLSAADVESTGSSGAADTEQTPKLKANIVSEITRLISASLTSTAKADTSSVERLVRWKGLGISPAAEEAVDIDATPLAAAPLPSASRRDIFSKLEKTNPRFTFTSGGVNAFFPLVHESWVVVVFQGQLWLGQGTLSMCGRS